MLKNFAWPFLGKRKSRGSGSFDNMKNYAITQSLLQYGFAEDTDHPTGCSRLLWFPNETLNFKNE